MENIISYEDKILDLRTFTVVEYKIMSPIRIIEERRFHQHIYGEIFEVNERGEQQRKIGSMIALILNF